MTRRYDKQASKSAAKQVICELVAASKGVLRGKLRLNKAFYFAHLYYWRDSEGVLTDYPIVRLPLGPCIDDSSDLIGELIAEGRLTVSVEPLGPYKENVYRLAVDCELDLSTPRGRAIFQAAEFTNGLSGAALSELTHEHSRSWQNTPNGNEMDIYADLLEDDEWQAIRRRVSAIRERETAFA